MTRAVFAIALVFAGISLVGCRERPKPTSGGSQGTTAAATRTTKTVQLAAPLPPLSIAQVESCDRKSSIWDQGAERKEREEKEAREAAERYKHVTRTLSEFTVGEEIWDVNLYAVDGKVYICCRGTEFGRTESGRWEGYPGARMRLRRAKDGWLLDCETPTTVITNSIQDAGNMQPIVGSFNDVRKKPKAVVKMMEAERQ